MIRKLFLSAAAIFLALTASAIPAKRQWRTVMVDGQETKAMLVGDENMHYFVTADGKKLTTYDDGKTFHIAGDAEFKKALQVRHAVKAMPRRIVSPKKARTFTGHKKAPVILVDYPDKKFAQDSAGINDFVNAMLNEQGYHDNGAVGSVHDYFNDMSQGTFDLTFDVYGPVTVDKVSTYYGGTSYYFGGTDYAGEWATDAITKAQEKYNIDWSQYDWDGDGVVEQVFLYYAGYGMATGGPTGTIWPHAWTLDQAAEGETGGSGAITINGEVINQYACGNELNGDYGTQKIGMGVFCHEFSHCMGLPDMYDTGYSSVVTMGDYDLLDHGSYNGPNGIGWVPAAWTSYERATAGWIDLKELQPNDTITGMKPLTDGNPEAYVIYNDGNRNEYYLLENRQKTSWDSYIPDGGLLIIHVDYDSTLFANNIVNSTGAFSRANGYDGNFTNDHQRMQPLYRVRSIANETYYMTYPMVGSRINIDSLTDNSNPAARLYNANTDSTMLMHKPVYDISEDANGDISFVYMPSAAKPTDAIEKVYSSEASTDGVWYNLYGQRVATPRNGILIRNGKKYIVK